MLAKGLAVVASEEGEDRGAGRGKERIEERREGRVRRRHLAEVGGVAVLGVEGGRRLIRRVGLEDVDPKKALPRRLPSPPVESAGNGVDAPPLGEGESANVGPLAVLVVVDIEAARQAPSRIERERRDERAGRIAALLQARGERWDVGTELRAGVVAEAVLEGEEPGQDVGVRGERDDVVSPGLREDAPLRREPVEGGRFQPRVAREAGGVRPPRVDGDEDDVGTGG